MVFAAHGVFEGATLVQTLLLARYLFPYCFVLVPKSQQGDLPPSNSAGEGGFFFPVCGLLTLRSTAGLPCLFDVESVLPIHAPPRWTDLKSPSLWNFRAALWFFSPQLPPSVCPPPWGAGFLVCAFASEYAFGRFPSVRVPNPINLYAFPSHSKHVHPGYSFFFAASGVGFLLFGLARGAPTF